MRKVLFFCFTWVAACLFLIHEVPFPTYLDAAYYELMARRLTTGFGLTDLSVPLFIAGPSHLPGAAFLYWMPLTSLVQAFVMLLVHQSSYAVAQLTMLLLWAAAAGLVVLIARQLAASVGLAVWLFIFSGIYFGLWATTDSFALYALLAGGCLAALGRALTVQRIQWWLLAGLLAGLSYLTRSDALLLAAIVVVYAWRSSARRGVLTLLVFGLVVSPWLLRSLSVSGALFPIGGFQTIFLHSASEFNMYPFQIVFNRLPYLLLLRLTGFVLTELNLVFNQGWLLLFPLVVLAVYRRRHLPFVQPFFWYAFLLHGLMAFVFVVPGLDGSLLHSASALMPFWAVFAALGTTDVRMLLSVQRWLTPVVAGYALLFSIAVFFSDGQHDDRYRPLYAQVDSCVPAGQVVMLGRSTVFAERFNRMAIPLPSPDTQALLKAAHDYQAFYLEVDTQVEVQPYADWLAGRGRPAFLKVVCQFSDGTVYHIED